MAKYDLHATAAESLADFNSFVEQQVQIIERAKSFADLPPEEQKRLTVNQQLFAGQQQKDYKLLFSAMVDALEIGLQDQVN